MSKTQQKSKTSTNLQIKFEIENPPTFGASHHIWLHGIYSKIIKENG